MKVTRIKLPGLRKSRQARKLSQPVLAKKAKVTAYQVAVAELGAKITTTVAQRIAAALGIKLRSLQS